MTVIAATAGGYPLRVRPGQGIPLVVIHPYDVTRSDRLLEQPALYGGRPLAMLGSKDMESFGAAGDVVVEDLLRATGWPRTGALHLLGQSAGGFAALLYGALMSLACPEAQVGVIAFSPLVSIWPLAAGSRTAQHSRVTTAGLADTRRQQNLERFGDARPWISKATAAGGGRFTARILYPGLNERDTAQAELLRDEPAVKLIPMPTTLHKYYSIIGIGKPREQEVDRTSQALVSQAAMEPEAARAEASALQDAFEAAARAEPEFFSVFASKRRPLNAA